MQLVQLRFRAVCAVCSSKLPPRAEAWHDDDAQRTVCLHCHRIETQAQAAVEAADAAAAAALNRVPVPDLNRAPRLVSARSDDDDASGDLGPELDLELDSALAEHARIQHEHAEADRIERERNEREAAARQEQQRTERSRSGIGIPRPKWSGNGSRTRSEPLSASPPTDLPVGERPTRLPQVGPSLAAGVDVDRDIAEDASSDDAIHRALEAARSHGLEVIRSRPWVGTRVESEAIVVGPSGVWIVDGLGTTRGPVERGFLAGHAGSELLNVVGGRTSIISGLLFDSPYQWVPVRGALCFDSGVPAWFDAPFSLAGITITTPRDLIDSLFMPLHLDAETRRGVAQHLVNRF